MGPQEQAIVLPPPAAGGGFVRRHSGVLAVALVAVLGFYVRSWEGDLYGDPVHYAAIARTMVSTGNWLDTQDAPGVLYARKPPLMLWLVALNFKLFGVSVYGARFWSCAFGVGVCLLTYLLGRRLFGETAGQLAGLMMAFFPGVSPNFSNLRLDSAVVFFTLLAVYGVVRADQGGRPRWLLLPGLAAGLGMMIKPSAALHVALFCGLLLAVRRPRLLIHPYALGAVVLAGAIAAPWHLAMIARHGDLFTRQYFGDWHLPIVAPYAVESTAVQVTRQVHRRALGEGHLFRNLAYYLAGASWRALPWWPLAAYALARRRRAGPQERAVMLVAVLWFLAILLLMALPPRPYNRYLIPAYPAIALLAGWGLCSLLSERARARVPAVAVGVALVLTCLAAVIPIPLHIYHCEGFAEARPLLDRLAPGATIATCAPEEPPGPSRLPEEWALRSCSVYYLDRTCVNYRAPEDVAAAGERFVIGRHVDREAFGALGYEPLIPLDGKYLLLGRWPEPPEAGGPPRHDEALMRLPASDRVCGPDGPSRGPAADLTLA